MGCLVRSSWGSSRLFPPPLASFRKYWSSDYWQPAEQKKIGNHHTVVSSKNLSHYIPSALLQKQRELIVLQYLLYNCVVVLQNVAGQNRDFISIDLDICCRQCRCYKCSLTFSKGLFCSVPAPPAKTQLSLNLTSLILLLPSPANMFLISSVILRRD